MSKIKRSLIRSFLNTGTVGVPIWSLISSGVPSATINMNPEVLKETYLDEDSATISVESYSPTIPIEATAIVGDEVYEWADSIRQGRDVLSDAEAEIVNVWAYKTSVKTYYLAEKSDASVSCETFGGEGGKAAKIAYTINQQGDPIIGSFDASGLEFFPAPINTILTTLDIGGETLTPTFATDKSWLWYSLAVPNGTSAISMDSTLAGATIVQKDDDDTVVSQSGNASLDVGENDLKVDVTVGAENVVYHIFVTRAAS